MRIHYSRPARGERQFICKGDEARVSRMLSGQYKDLAERLQKTRLGPVRSALAPSFFSIEEYNLRRKPMIGGAFAPREPAYHILKILANQLARELFPENFARQHELRIFRKKGFCIYASYSDFIPDETQTVQRKTAGRERFYDALRGKGDKRYHEVRDELDTAERGLVPGLVELVEKLRSAGIVIMHPEVNYHVHDGRPVFFDVDGLVLNPLVESAKGNVAQSSLLGPIFATMVKVVHGEGEFLFHDESFDRLQKLFSLYFHSFVFQAHGDEFWLTRLRRESAHSYDAMWNASIRRGILPEGIGEAVQIDDKVDRFLEMNRKIRH